jgi:hypothetical protein
LTYRHIACSGNTEAAAPQSLIFLPKRKKNNALLLFAGFSGKLLSYFSPYLYAMVLIFSYSEWKGGDWLNQNQEHVLCLMLYVFLRLKSTHIKFPVLNVVTFQRLHIQSFVIVRYSYKLRLWFIKVSIY